MSELALLLKQIDGCRLCVKQLPNEPKPILRAHTESKLLIVGQAPGIRAHKTGTPWNDPSGDRLRAWLDLDRNLFYNEKKIAIIPMGYCYPGTGPSGDYPPIKICSKRWLPSLLSHLPNIQLTLLIGHYAQAHYLQTQCKATLTRTVRAFKEYLPKYLPLPHPSPRNNHWLRNNPWFEEQVIPVVRQHCHHLLHC